MLQTIKLDIFDSFWVDDAIGLQSTTGKLVGNKIKFTTKKCSYSEVRDDGLHDVTKYAKISGVITLVNTKTIKLKITSKDDPNGCFKNYKLFKVGKTTTLRREKN